MTATVTARSRVRPCVLKRGLDNLRTSTQSFTARPAPLGENNAPGAGPPAPPTQGVKHGISPVVRKCTAGIDPSPQDGHLRGRQRAALEMMSPSKTAFARPTHSRRQFHNNRKSD